jgi:hypothetical protein
MKTSAQYTYRFSATNGKSYTLVASRYEQARKHFLKVFTGFLCVTSEGRYHGEPVRNGKCIAIK